MSFSSGGAATATSEASVDEASDGPAALQKISSNSANKPFSVKGSLKRNIDFWRVIGADNFICDVIENGYKLPLKTTPEPSFLYNNFSALREQKFVSNEISQLILKGCIKETVRPPKVVNPLSVAINSNGKKRLILDLRYINDHLFKFGVKYEAFDILTHYVTKNGYTINFDMKSGYHHVDIFEQHQCYLGFSFIIDNKTRFFQFSVLPFGLSTACNIFTKIFRPLVKHWRSRGIKIILYLDDGIVAHSDKLLLEDQSKEIYLDMKKAGIVINEEKSCWIPSQNTKWLGLIVNLISFQYEAPLEKISSLKQVISSLLKSEFTTCRQIAKVTGKITSLHLAYGPITKLFTKALHCIVVEGPAWDRKIRLSMNARSELLFWSHNLSERNGCSILSETPKSLQLYTDASGSGGGGYIDSIPNSITRVRWSESEAAASSTHRELNVLFYTLNALSVYLRDNFVTWYCDNQAACRIITNGSMKEDLQRLALEIFRVRENLKLIIFPVWIPREMNQRADGLSKLSVSDEWSVSHEVFNFLNIKWGPFTSDRFADHLNKKCAQFNSQFCCPGSTAVNSFTCDWSKDFNWLVPPVSLAIKTIRHLQFCKAEGCLIVPLWKSAAFWPLISDTYGNFHQFVSDYVIFNDLDNFFAPNSADVNFRSPMLALRLSFSH